MNSQMFGYFQELAEEIFEIQPTCQNHRSRMVRWFGSSGAVAGGQEKFGPTRGFQATFSRHSESQSLLSSNSSRRSHCELPSLTSKLWKAHSSASLFSEFVRSHNNIMKYNCEQKLDYIKKGMGEFNIRPTVPARALNFHSIADKHRTNNKKMSNFPADVAKAEQLTGGDENILSGFETPTKQKPTKSLFATPEKSFTEATSASASKKSAGAYNSSSKVQFSVNPAPKSDKKYTCTLCDFSTERINLLMLHIKNHSSSFPSRVNG